MCSAWLTYFATYSQHLEQPLPCRLILYSNLQIYHGFVQCFQETNDDDSVDGDDDNDDDDDDDDDDSNDDGDSNEDEYTNMSVYTYLKR